MKSSFLSAAILGLVARLISQELRAAEPPQAIEWQAWSDDVFARAAKEHRFVLLDLGAGWCHWCHVMDQVTYADPAVVALIRSKYLPVHVDQDSRPDLANRYEDYGWPATIVFNTDGSEIVKRQGYIPPKPMASLLQAIIDDPSPGPSVQPETAITEAPAAALSPEQRTAIRQALITTYDEKQGGWGDVRKYLNWDALEYCVTEGAAGDAQMEAMARKTLSAGTKLIDPVWGGVYQYSTDGDWDHPHFEKIMPFQAENLRIFALASTLWHEPAWITYSDKIHGYLDNFLRSPEGAFYTSQDADLVQGEHGGEYFALDDQGRRKLGIPRIDKHCYTRENGLAITGLAACYAATGDPSTLSEAERAAAWVQEHRALPEGGFSHDEHDAAGPYLADSLAMGRAFLALYHVTADRRWLAQAEKSAAFMDAKFRAQVGFCTAAGSTGTLAAKPQLDENIFLTRFANLLYQITGKDSDRSMAEHGMRYLASPAVTDRLGLTGAGVLLADREFRTDPIHITIVGSKSDARAKALFATALKNAPQFTRLEWHDAQEGPLPRTDVEYPTLPEPAAFLCSNGTCSAPLQSPEKLEARLAKALKSTRSSK